MHKRILRSMTAFSLATLISIFSGAASASAVSVSPSISELKAARASLEEREAENRNTVAALAAQVAEKRAACDVLSEKISILETKLTLTNTALSGSYGEAAEALLEAERNAAAAVAEGERIAAEKQAVLAEIEAWNAAQAEALEAAAFNAAGTPEAQAAAVSLAGFQWPAPGYTFITCAFGEDGHRGVDISGNGINGAEIVAARGGTVTYSGWHDSYGWCVFIDHGNGMETRYAHASALACETGDTVGAGEIIAYVGSTGNSTGPHLHFEVLQDGALLSPLDQF